METSLYQPVKAFLEAAGYEVKGEVGGCDRDPCPPCGRVAEPRKREQGQSGSQGQEDDQTEHVHLTVTRSRTPTARTATAWT